MKQLKYTRLDFNALAITVVLLVIIIVLNLIPMPFLAWLI